METKNKKIMALALFCASLMVMGIAVGNVLSADAHVEIMESSVIGLVVGGMIAVIIAGALLPTIFNQSDNAVDEAEDFNRDTEAALIDLWPLLIVVGVMLAIIGMAL